MTHGHFRYAKMPQTSREPSASRPTTMQLSKENLNRAISNLLAFMEKDLEETLEDLEDDIDESYTLTKNRIIWAEIQQISRSYSKQERKMKEKFKLDEQVWLNQGRLELLRARHAVVQGLLDEPRRVLRRASRHDGLYPKLLYKLLLQGLLQLLEPRVLVIARGRDVELVQQTLEPVRARYRSATGSDVRLRIHPTANLPEEVLGGVALLAASGRVYTDLTLDTRLALVAQYMLPQIRNEMFGPLSLRKHQDQRESMANFQSVLQLFGCFEEDDDSEDED